MFEKIFPTDVISKRERVERTLNHQPVDRVALYDQLSNSPGAVSLYTGKNTEGYNYTVEDVGEVIRQTLDMSMHFRGPLGTDRWTDEFGTVRQNDNWTTWYAGRAFSDVEGAKEWLRKRINKELKNQSVFNKDRARREYKTHLADIQKLAGETVFFDHATTGFQSVYTDMGLELFTYFYDEHPDDINEFMEIATENVIRKIVDVIDPTLSPATLIADDFGTKQGPIFSPEFLSKHLFPYVKKLTEALHSMGVKVIYHSDGNYKRVIPDLIQCGVDGFFCLEPNCGMEVVELKRTWPEMVWMGGVDGVDLMERGSPEDVRKEVKRHITETGVLHTGGMFIGTSSDMSPMIKPENFKAMVDAVGEFHNPNFFA